MFAEGRPSADASASTWRPPSNTSLALLVEQDTAATALEAVADDSRVRAIARWRR